MKTSITEVAGVGPVAAKALAEHGINSVEDLARTDPVQLSTVPGFGIIRAKQCVAAATALVGARPATRAAESTGTPEPAARAKQRSDKGRKGKKGKKKKPGKGGKKKTDNKKKDKRKSGDGDSGKGPKKDRKPSKKKMKPSGKKGKGKRKGKKK
jgi:hypothetical protein